MAILDVSNLSRSFGGLKAVSGLGFTVARGAIKAVIGPNGAGKTTLFNLISGFLEPAQGSAIMFEGRPIHGLRPHQVAALGVSRTFQHIRLFPKMTALENVMVGRHSRSRAGFLSGMMGLPSGRLEERSNMEKSMEVMDFVGIAHLAEAEATTLSFGQQRSVELARALASEPGILLLDEPASGLNIHETQEMARLIMKIREMGVTVLIVEHDMSLVMNISDEVLVLCYGRKIAEDAPLAIQKNQEVINVYLGEDGA